ncbi:alpha-ketoglutarate dehydrogenase [Undibacterium macrobrachii]|nr:alpha-ketoglutarate dehydrogenase [Undibacterium macrobrachii]
MNARLQNHIAGNLVSMIDPDPEETAEWRDAFAALIAVEGKERACQILDMLSSEAHRFGVEWENNLNTPYRNSISVEQQANFPGDLEIEKKLGAIIRWNALVMVVRANQAYGELGGHVASYASAADLFETGYHHFFHAKDAEHGGDLVFFQPHSAPGVYARAFLEGRLSETDLCHYRQEVLATSHGARGLSSYPHPWLMPDFWQFPTGSMGLGPISSIYHARFMRYLSDRKLLDCSGRKVWGVFGDGEMDEPESMSALTLAAREKLDNLVWVVNCNLQRLDGPVRGNSRIIDELERLFVGAGWKVIKLLWGSDWDGLLSRDHDGALQKALGDTVDGQMQTFAAKDGRYNREHFFGQNEALSKLIAGMSDEQIDKLKRGGHDPVKIFAAYAAASSHQGQPTVILAHTKKGYGMGSAGEGKMTTHSQKKLSAEDLIAFRDRFDLPLTDQQAADLEFIKPSEESAEIRYLHQQRQRLGGYLPKRQTTADALVIPELSSYANFALQADGKEMSTTMAFVRMLGTLLKDAQLGPRIVPIVADEARTFGMANLFKQVGIYSSVGQQYAPEDIGSVLSYREAVDGQILEEGISEAGAIASWTAAATSYSVHGLSMLPFYIYYSMFGFQRVGDAIWAAADQRSRGFLLGATSGRTTLGGEGLQHQDGSSHLVSATIPNCKSYDPAFAGELAVILDRGMRDMYVEQNDVFYYITLMNENYAQPNLPQDKHQDVIRGCYDFAYYPAAAQNTAQSKVQENTQSITLLGSGAILVQVIAAAELLAAQGVNVFVLSVTSWSELARDGMQSENAKLNEAKPIPFIAQQLAHTHGPILAASDYVRALPESIRAYIPQDRTYRTLGTDGFGRSDTRQILREFFGIDAHSIVETAQHLLTK